MIQRLWFEGVIVVVVVVVVVVGGGGSVVRGNGHSVKEEGPMHDGGPLIECPFGVERGGVPKRSAKAVLQRGAVRVQLETEQLIEIVLGPLHSIQFGGAFHSMSLQ